MQLWEKGYGTLGGIEEVYWPDAEMFAVLYSR